MKGVKLPMKINGLSSFAAGIFVTTTILGAVYFFDDSDQSTDQNESTKKQEENVQLTETEMKAELEALGYVVQTVEENNQDVEAARQESGEQTENNAEPNPDESAEAVTRVVVNVSSGMTSIDVGRVLEDAKLIDKSAFEFSKDIESRGIENKLRPGTYNVDSSMSYDEMISTIFK